MTFQIEYEAPMELGFDHEPLIERVILGALDYAGCPYEVEVSVTLTDNAGIQEINRNFRNIDAPTDVLSFPMISYETAGDFSHAEDSPEENFNPESGELLLGDIVLSVEKILEQAEKFGHSRERELAFLVAHSMLHLFGYDHIEEEDRFQMEAKQKELLDMLHIYR